MRLAYGQCEQSRFPADGLIKLGGGREHVAPFCPLRMSIEAENWLSVLELPTMRLGGIWGDYQRSLFFCFIIFIILILKCQSS